MNLDVEAYLYRETGIQPTVTVDRFQNTVAVQIGNSRTVYITRYQIERLVAIRNSHTAWDVNWVLAEIILNELNIKNNGRT